MESVALEVRIHVVDVEAEAQMLKREDVPVTSPPSLECDPSPTYLQPRTPSPDEYPSYIMAPKPNPRLDTLLRYTYQANMVFFAGFATWYFLKGPDQKQLSGNVSTQRKPDAPASKQ
jgi:hypothetical protein